MRWITFLAKACLVVVFEGIEESGDEDADEEIGEGAVAIGKEYRRGDEEA